MQFYKTLSSLNAKYKYGLTATLYAKPKDISSTPIFLLGDVLHEVDREDIKQLTAKHIRVDLSTPPDREYILPDQTIDYTKMITYLASNQERTLNIFNNLFQFNDRHNLVLTSRNELIQYLSTLFDQFDIDHRVIVGNTKMKDRLQFENDF